MNFMDGDSNFELILYLIIVVGGILVNAYRSISKKKEKERKRIEQSEVNFPEIEVEAEYNPQPEQAYVFESETEPESVHLEQEFDVENDERAILEGVAALTQTEAAEHPEGIEKLVDSFGDEPEENQESIDVYEDEWKETTDKGDSPTFDLKKAIIYSEIINTKYI